jgi:hypothetical protein
VGSPLLDETRAILITCMTLYIARLANCLRRYRIVHERAAGYRQAAGHRRGLVRLLLFSNDNRASRSSRVTINTSLSPTRSRPCVSAGSVFAPLPCLRIPWRIQRPGALHPARPMSARLCLSHITVSGHDPPHLSCISFAQNKASNLNVTRLGRKPQLTFSPAPQPLAAGC